MGTCWGWLWCCSGHHSLCNYEKTHTRNSNIDINTSCRHESACTHMLCFVIIIFDDHSSAEVLLSSKIGIPCKGRLYDWTKCSVFLFQEDTSERLVLVFLSCQSLTSYEMAPFQYVSILSIFDGQTLTFSHMAKVQREVFVFLNHQHCGACIFVSIMWHRLRSFIAAW